MSNISITNERNYYAEIPADRDIVYKKKANEKEETTIGYNNASNDEKYRIYRKVCLEYYEKMNRINKSHPNPEKYIQDKYFNQSSIHFRNDMTTEERLTASRNELSMLKDGKPKYDSFYDYALRGYEGIYGGYVPETEKENQYSRYVINQQINQLFKQNNIVIPEGVNITFLIDPYNFILKAEGSEDRNLLNEIERVLNIGDNAKNLYYHTLQCMHGAGNEIVNNQINETLYKKTAIWREVMNATGYDLRNLLNENGTFYTEDGQDLLEIYKNSSLTPAVGKEHYLPFIQKLAKQGFNATADMILSIGYNQHGFYDIGQEEGYGYGQNDWLKALISNTDKTINRFDMLA